MADKIEWGGIDGPYEVSPAEHWDKTILIYAGRRPLIEVDYDDMGEDEMLRAEVTARAAAEVPAMVDFMRAFASGHRTISVDEARTILARIDGK